MKRALDYDVVKKDLEEFPDETVRARAKRLGCNQNTLGQYILDLRDPSRKVAKSKKIHEAMRKLKEDLEKFPSSSASERAARLGYAGPASIHYLLNLQSKCNKKRSTHQLEYNFVSTQKPLPNDEYFLPTSYNKRARKDNDFTRTGQKTSRNCQSTGT